LEKNPKINDLQSEKKNIKTLEHKVDLTEKAMHTNNTYCKTMISIRNMIISTIENIIIVSGGGQNFMLLSYWPSVLIKNLKSQNKKLKTKKQSRTSHKRYIKLRNIKELALTKTTIIFTTFINYTLTYIIRRYNAYSSC